jgi:membrane protease YdiL (CAAX protease family)
MAAEPYDESDAEYDPNEADRGFGRRLTRKEQVIEVGVFLLLIVPTMILSYFVTQQANGGGESFMVLAAATIVRDLALVGLIIFFLWRNGESTARIGWTYKHLWADIILGIVLFFPVFLAASALGELLERMGLSGPSPETMPALFPRSPEQFALAITLVIVVAVSEEFIFRGYLIRRFSSTTRSVALAVIISSVIFAFGHGYQGTAGVIAVGFIGLAFALIYVWRGSLVAPVVMHFLQNFIGIVVLPYLRLQ